MLRKNDARWNKRVKIVGISIDSSIERVKHLVEEKDWKSIEHYHIDRGTCKAEKEFGVKSIPHVALIDKTGKIAFVGHYA